MGVPLARPFVTAEHEFDPDGRNVTSTIQNGEYILNMTDSRKWRKSDSDPECVVFTWEIQDSPDNSQFKGKKVRQYLYLWGSDGAQRYARGKMAEISNIFGIDTWQNTEVLEGKNIGCNLSMREYDNKSRIEFGDFFPARDLSNSEKPSTDTRSRRRDVEGDDVPF